ncbi:MAG: 5'-methylthioadenosine/S-adenosylhomocysteine nucleosidase [Oscillospiraceae bacterium]
MKKNIGIIFADDLEFKPFEDYAKINGAEASKLCGCNKITMQKGEKIIHAIESGVGKVNATVATCVLIEQCGVSAMLNAGLSGAISGMQREDIVAGESCVECDFDLRAFGYPQGQKPTGERVYSADEELLNIALDIKGIKKAKLGTGDFFLADKNKKDKYSEIFGINAFDMESVAIAIACSKYAVPFLSLRKISDDADDKSVSSYREMNQKCEKTLTEVLLKIIEKI